MKYKYSRRQLSEQIRDLIDTVDRTESNYDRTSHEKNKIALEDILNSLNNIEFDLMTPS